MKDSLPVLDGLDHTSSRVIANGKNIELVVSRPNYEVYWV